MKTFRSACPPKKWPEFTGQHLFTFDFFGKKEIFLDKSSVRCLTVDGFISVELVSRTFCGEFQTDPCLGSRRSAVALPAKKMLFSIFIFNFEETRPSPVVLKIF